MSTSSRRNQRPAVLSHDCPSMPSPKRLTYQSDPKSARPVSVAEASSQYRGEWVLMEVTGTDGQTHEALGTVLAHSTARGEISKAVRRAHKANPTVHLYVFPGGIQRLYGDALKAALAEGAAKEPYANARW
jgi:hypothetical protein